MEVKPSVLGKYTFGQSPFSTFDTNVQPINTIWIKVSNDDVIWTKG